MRIDIGSELLEAYDDGDSAAFCPRGILGAALGRGVATATMSTSAHPLFRYNRQSAALFDARDDCVLLNEFRSVSLQSVQRVDRYHSR